jgi:hypothetical protein
MEPAMNASTMASQDGRHYELRFRSLFDAGRAYTFPCDASGQVTMDALSERALCNYLYVRAMIGREYRFPQVEAVLQ